MTLLDQYGAIPPIRRQGARDLRNPQMSNRAARHTR
jgi:hypothetical protein